LFVNVYRLPLLAAICLALFACSGGATNGRIDYEGAKTLPPLDVPPDLSTPVDTGTENIPEVNSVASIEGRKLLRGKGIRIARDGSTRWLVIDASTAKLWPQLRKFWSTIGLKLVEDEPKVGIMETEWGENRADAPSGYIADMVKKVFKNAYSADTRDKYRLRVEPTGKNRTELFITHYGMKEVVVGQVEGFSETTWKYRPSDPELENEILNRLVLFLGGDKSVAKAVLQSQPKKADSRTELKGSTLILKENFSRSWRLVGLALDRIGLVVEDRNHSKGLYYISRVESILAAKNKNWLSSLFSSEPDKADQKQWQLKISGKESTTIRVLDEQGKPVDEKLAVPLLQRLQESLQ
jgi:outer membrane protein assembly factor BamC